MSNQDIEGNLPAGEAPGAPAGTPEYFEQQLAKEREAKAMMRDRLRHTEALAAESHALRSRMAQELERVTADRDRLRTAASAAANGAQAPSAAAGAAAPPMTPRSVDWPLRPPEPPRRSGPWRALAMLGGLAVAVGALAWFTGSFPGERPSVAATSTPGTAPVVASASAAATPRPPAPAASTAVASTAPAFPLPSGAVALPPLTLTPEQQLAAAPTAAAPAPAAAPAGMAARLRKALDGEGISSPVELDASSGHVMVADPQSDYALRDRTDMLIRAVYAGASLPEPQIEHRWLSPKRGEMATPLAQAAPPPAPARAPEPDATTGPSPAAAYAARHAAAEHHKKPAAATVADAEELRPVLPEGRVTASCRASLAGKTLHRANLTACMRLNCCSAGNGQAEECRAYVKAYPFTCSAG